VATAPERSNHNSSTPASSPPALSGLFTEALDHHRAGRFVEAAGLYGRILALSPGRPEVHSNLGAALASIGQHAEAEASYLSAIRLNPDYSGAHNNLGNLLKVMGRLDEAEAAFGRAVALSPDYAEAHSNLGVVLATRDRHADAEAAYRRAIAIKPDFAGAYNNLANLLREIGRPDAAEAACRQAIMLQPNYHEAFANYGNILKDLGRLDQAEAALRQAIALRPDYAEAHSNLGNVLMDQGRVAEAETVLRRAIELRPDYAGAHNNLGLALKELGRVEEARHAAAEAIRLSPRRVTYYCNLAEVTRFKPGDPHVAALEELAKDEASLPADDRIALHFALARAREQADDTEAAFRHLVAGNALKRAHVGYDEAAVLDGMAEVERVFSPALIAANASAGEPSRIPVFIVGMLRSGTTLVEQILASHPSVFGAGELPLFDRAVGSMRPAFPGSPPYPQIAAGMTGEHFRELGARYAGELRRLAPHAARITDKMPSNFVFAGLIHLALPNAVIIHTVRDPVDTCMSCYSRLFTEGQRHTYDLAELGRYYRRYQSMMAHWHRLLPPGRILDVRYEDVVADLEGAARRIIAHCGLDWNPRCLDFHRTERPVRTASATQVRQPIYTSSIGRARAYGENIAPLLDALAGAAP
jgi:Flp pilus assembly protein TadD